MAESRKSKSPASPNPVGGVPMLVPAGNYEGKPGLKLAKPVILVGAKADCHLHLLSSTVSQHHAVILTCSDGVLVRDLASRTRTYINGRPVHEGKLEDGDELKIGKFTFRFDANGFVPGPERVAPDFQIVPDDENPIALTKRVVVIGRRTTCDIPLIEESCSTTHALLLNMEGRWVVRDLTSRTGTRVNGGAVRVKELMPGDVIRVGETDLRFERVREIEPVVTDADLDVGGAPANDDLLSLAGEPLPDARYEAAEPMKASADDSALELATPPDPAADSFAPLPVVESPVDAVAPVTAENDALASIDPDALDLPVVPEPVPQTPVDLEPVVEAQATEIEPAEELTPEAPRPRRGWRAMGLEPGDELTEPGPRVAKSAPFNETPVVEAPVIETPDVETPDILEPPSAVQPPMVVETPVTAGSAFTDELAVAEPAVPVVEPATGKAKRKSPKPVTKKPSPAKTPVKGRGKSKATPPLVLPTADAPVPVNEASTPVHEAPAPANENQSPIIESPAPAVETGAVLLESAGPVVEVDAPLVEFETPIVEADAPIVEADAPLVEADALTVLSPEPIVDERPLPAVEVSAPVALVEDDIADLLAGPDEPLVEMDLSTPVEMPASNDPTPEPLADLPPTPVGSSEAPTERSEASVESAEAPMESAEAPMESADVLMESADALIELSDTPIELSDSMHPLQVFTDALPKPVTGVAPKAEAPAEPTPLEPKEVEAPIVEAAVARLPAEPVESVAPAGPGTSDVHDVQSDVHDVGSDVHDMVVDTPGDEAPTITFDAPALDLGADAPVPVADLEHIDFTSPGLVVPDASDVEDDDDTLPPLASLDELEAEDQAPEALPVPARSSLETPEDAPVDAIDLDSEPEEVDIDSTDTVAEVVEPEALPTADAEAEQAPVALGEEDVDALLNDDVVGPSGPDVAPDRGVEIVSGRDEIIEPARPEPDSATILDDVLADVETPALIESASVDETSSTDLSSDSEIVSESDSALTLETGDLADDALLDVSGETLIDAADMPADALSDSTLGRELDQLAGDSAGPLVDVVEPEPVVVVPQAVDDVTSGPERSSMPVEVIGIDEIIETPSDVPGTSDEARAMSAQAVETVDESVSLEESVESYDVITAAASEAGNVTTDIIGAAAATDLIDEDVSGAGSIDLPLPDLIDLTTLTDDFETPVSPLDLPALDASTDELALDALKFDEPSAEQQGDLSEVALDPVDVAPEVSTESVGAVSASPSMDAIEQSPTPVVSTVVQEDNNTEDVYEEVQVPAAQIIPIDQAPAQGTLAAIQAITVTRPAWADIPPQLLSFDDDDVAPPAPRQVARATPPVAPPEPSNAPADTGFDPFAPVGANMEHFLGGMGIDLRAPVEEQAPPPPSFGHVSVAFDAKPGWGEVEPVVGKVGSQNGHAGASHSDDDDDDDASSPPAPVLEVEQKPRAPRTTRPRAIPFSQKAGPIDVGRTASPAPAPAYTSAPKASSPFDGLAVGSLGIGGAVRQTDVFFNMPSTSEAPASAATGAGSSSGAGVAPTQPGPIPYAGTRVATAPVGRELSVAPGVPIAPPVGVSTPSAPRHVRRLGVRGLVGLMLVTLAALCTGVYFLVPYRSTVVATVVYDNFEALGDGDRAWFMDRQEKIIGGAPTRDAAKKRLAGISPETPAGFLGDPIAFDRLTLPGKMKWAPDTGTLELTATGDEAEAQRKRLTALVGAIYDANLSFVNDAEGVKKSIEQLRSAIDRSVRDKEELERQIAEAKRVRENAPDPMRVKALADDVARLETDAAQAARKVRDLQAEFDRLTVAPGATGVTGSAELAPTDPDLVKMRQELVDLNAKLAASRESAVKQTDAAKQSLDAALDAFNKRVAAAQDLMGASPELSRYVTAAQKMQEATKKITNELIASQQESVTRITETRRNLDEINAKRRAERIMNDAELKQMQENLEFNRRKLNAATGSADSQLVDAKTLDELRGTIEILKAQIQSRQEQVGEDKFDREASAQLESLITQSQKQMDDNRKKYEGILDTLAKEFASAAPAVEQLTAEQKQLAETLAKQATELSDARKQYSDALGTASTESQKEIEKASLEVKARIEARATELAEASKKNTASRAEQDRIKLAEQKQKELSAAKLTSASAEVALKKAKDDLWDAQKLTELASTANDRTAEYNERLKALTVQLTSQRDAFDAKKKEASRSVAPHKPAPADVVIKENVDPRPNWMMGAVAVTCVAYSILIALASHRKSNAPARPTPTNGHALNGNGKSHEPAEENETASV